MVYIDWLRTCKPTKRWRHNQACHLFADSLTELHAFARGLGMPVAWFQNRRIPHYDLSEGTRRRAIEHGAREILTREEWKVITERLCKEAKTESNSAPS